MSKDVSRRGALIGATGLGVLGLAAAAGAPAFGQGKKAVTLLNVSYDPTRELYRAYNPVFAADWKRKSGQDVTIEQSHGGSGKQALSVINGLQADVVTLGIASDIDAIVQKAKLVDAGWARRLPNESTPYTSTIVFLVRKGNPKRIKDFQDLLQPGLQVITPNPKTSAGGRWGYVALYAWALRQPGGSPAKAREFLQKVYASVPVLDTGARGSTTTFAQRGLGDVLIAWENEAYLAIEEMGAGKLEIVTPRVSMLAEPPVAWVDKVVEQKGTAEVAQAYLKGLYTQRGQEIVAQQHYRPRNAAVLAKYGSKFPRIELINVRSLGGWGKLQPEHFGDGGVFDQIYKPH